jgi:hypothetical protein
MTSVSRKEGFRYGFYVFAYWLVLLVFSAALVAAGGYIVEMQNLGDVGINEDTALAVLGGFVTLLGVLVFGSGQVGLVYKVVADGVSVGNSVEGQASDTGPDPAASPAGVPEERAPDERRETQEEPDERPANPGQPRERPRQSVATDDPSSEGDKPTTGTDHPTRDTGTDHSTQDTGETPPPRETNSRPRASHGDHAEERSVDTETSGAEVSGARDRKSESDRPERPVETTGEAGTPGRTGEESGDQSESTEQRADGQTGDRQRAGEGDRTGDGPAGDGRESPEDVANESDIAEELGFDGEENAPDDSADGVGTETGSDGQTSRDVETAETVVDADAGKSDGDTEAGTEADGDASALDWGGSETTGGASETESPDGVTGTSDGDELDTGSGTGSGSLADALAGEGGDEDESTDGGGDGQTASGDGADADDADDAESPRWSTGENHEGGPGQGDGDGR